MNTKTKIIADVSSNHMGDMQIAASMVKLAAEAGVDAVKFQSWQSRMLRKDYPEYESTFARHKKAELSEDDHRLLMDVCAESGIEFLTTCFDLDRVDFLASLGLPAIKVASSDCTSSALLERLCDAFSQVIVSTGMSTDEEVEALVRRVEGKNVIVLHCVSIYPTPLDQVNLRRMDWIRSQGVRVGLSDHSLGTEAGKLAIAMGAEVLEKHYTLSRNLPGKDQAMSTEIHEFKELVEWSHTVASMLGTEKPGLSDQEKALRHAYIGKWGDNR